MLLGSLILSLDEKFIGFALGFNFNFFVKSELKEFVDFANLSVSDSIKETEICLPTAFSSKLNF